MRLLSRSCRLPLVHLASSSLALATAAATTAQSCPSDSYTACGGDLPGNFCCSAGSTCVVTFGSSSVANTTVICCPQGSDCTLIAPITCEVQLLNATAYPESHAHTTELFADLETCGSQCCPPGFSCQDSICKQASKHVATGANKVVTASSTSTTKSTKSTTTTHTTKTALSSSSSSSSALSTTKASSLALTTTTSASATSTSTSSSTATTTAASTSPKTPYTPTKTVIISSIIAAIVGVALLAMFSWHYRRRLQHGWHRLTSRFSRGPRSSSSSSLSSRSDSSSVKYTTHDNDDDNDDNDTPHLRHLNQQQHQAPTWTIPLSADWWWEPVKRQWPWVKPPWQSPQSTTTTTAPAWHKLQHASTSSTTTTTTTTTTTVTSPRSHDPETGLGILLQPPPPAAAAKKNTRNPPASNFIRRKSLPQRAVAYPAAPAQPHPAPAAGIPSPREAEGASVPSPVPSHSGPSPPQDGHSSVPSRTQRTPQTPQAVYTSQQTPTISQHTQHSTPPQPSSSSPRRPSSLWPSPLRPGRQVSDNGYFPATHAGGTYAIVAAHGRSVSDTPPQRHRLGTQHRPQNNNNRLSQLPPLWRRPLPVALQALPSQARPAETERSAPPPPPIELPATPVTARLLGASDLPPPGYAQPINAFGIIKTGSRADTARQTPQEDDRRMSYVPRNYSFAPVYGDPQPVCPYPQTGHHRPLVEPPPTPPTPPTPPVPARNAARESSTAPSPSPSPGPSRQHHRLHPLSGSAPPALPPIPRLSAMRPWSNAHSPLSVVTQLQQPPQQPQQPPPQPPQHPPSARVDTPMSYQTVPSPLSPTSPRIEEAQMRRLPRMAQAVMLQQQPRPGVVADVRQPSYGERVAGVPEARPQPSFFMGPSFI